MSEEGSEGGLSSEQANEPNCKGRNPELSGCMMRKKSIKDGVSVKAYAGTTGILLGMNVEPDRRPGLLGFALERLDGSSGEKE
jgi:hypothetical protein